MKTASFSSYRGPGRIGITVGRPREIKRAEYEIYPQLAPEWSWLGLPYDEYRPLYFERLEALDAQQVWDELHALVPGQEPVLLCFEQPPLTVDNWCHRQMVAEWFADELGVAVTELEVEAATRPTVKAVGRGSGMMTPARERLSDRKGFISPSSRLLDEPVTLEEFQELCERHYGALEAWWQAQRKDDEEQIAEAGNEVGLARTQVRAGYRRMSEMERALALHRWMIPVSVIQNL